MKTKEQLKREIYALRQNICWVHGDDLLRGIAEPSYGIPSGYESEVQKQYPFHGLFVDLGCLAALSDQTKGQVVNVCPTCKKEALIYLETHENE